MAILGVILLISANQLNGSSIKIERNKVEMALIKRTYFSESIPVDGTIEPQRSIMLAASESGSIEERWVEEGAFVEKGQALLRMANSDLQLELMNREEQLSAEQSRLIALQHQARKNSLSLNNELVDTQHQFELSKRQFKSDSFLYKNAALSKQDYELSVSNLNHLQKKIDLIKERASLELQSDTIETNQLQKSIEIKKRNLELVRQSFEKLIVRALEDGQLTSIDAELGEYKTKGQTLGQLDVKKGYKVKGRIDEHFLTRVSLGQLAKVNIDQQDYLLKIKQIFPQIRDGKFTVELYFVDAPPEAISVGLSIQFKLEFGGSTLALVAPRGSWLSANSSVAYVVKNDVAIRNNITTGRQNNEVIEIISGLQEGDQIIVSNYDIFKQKEHIDLSH